MKLKKALAFLIVAAMLVSLTVPAMGLAGQPDTIYIKSGDTVVAFGFERLTDAIGGLTPDPTYVAAFNMWVDNADEIYFGINDDILIPDGAAAESYSEQFTAAQPTDDNVVTKTNIDTDNNLFIVTDADEDGNLTVEDKDGTPVGTLDPDGSFTPGPGGGTGPEDEADDFLNGEYADVFELDADSVTIGVKDDVTNAQTAFGQLSEEAKAIILAEAGIDADFFTGLLNKIAALEFIEEYTDVLDLTVGDVDTGDEGDVIAARDAFNVLDADIQAIILAEAGIADTFFADLLAAIIQLKPAGIATLTRVDASNTNNYVIRATLTKPTPNLTHANFNIAIDGGGALDGENYVPNAPVTGTKFQVFDNSGDGSAYDIYINLIDLPTNHVVSANLKTPYDVTAKTHDVYNDIAVLNNLVTVRTGAETAKITFTPDKDGTIVYTVSAAAKATIAAIDAAENVTKTFEAGDEVEITAAVSTGLAYFSYYSLNSNNEKIYGAAVVISDTAQKEIPDGVYTITGSTPTEGEMTLLSDDTSSGTFSYTSGSWSRTAVAANLHPNSTALVALLGTGSNKLAVGDKVEFKNGVAVAVELNNSADAARTAALTTGLAEGATVTLKDTSSTGSIIVSTTTGKVVGDVILKGGTLSIVGLDIGGTVKATGAGVEIAHNAIDANVPVVLETDTALTANTATVTINKITVQGDGATIATDGIDDVTVNGASADDTSPTTGTTVVVAADSATITTLNIEGLVNTVTHNGNAGDSVVNLVVDPDATLNEYKFTDAAITGQTITGAVEKVTVSGNLAGTLEIKKGSEIGTLDYTAAQTASSATTINGNVDVINTNIAGGDVIKVTIGPDGSYGSMTKTGADGNIATLEIERHKVKTDSAAFDVGSGIVGTLVLTGPTEAEKWLTVTGTVTTANCKAGNLDVSGITGTINDANITGHAEVRLGDNAMAVAGANDTNTLSILADVGAVVDITTTKIATVNGVYVKTESASGADVKPYANGIEVATTDGAGTITIDATNAIGGINQIKMNNGTAQADFTVTGHQTNKITLFGNLTASSAKVLKIAGGIIDATNVTLQTGAQYLVVAAAVNGTLTVPAGRALTINETVALGGSPRTMNIVTPTGDAIGAVTVTDIKGTVNIGKVAKDAGDAVTIGTITAGGVLNIDDITVTTSGNAVTYTTGSGIAGTLKVTNIVGGPVALTGTKSVAAGGTVEITATNDNVSAGVIDGVLKVDSATGAGKGDVTVGTVTASSGVLQIGTIIGKLHITVTANGIVSATSVGKFDLTDSASGSITIQDVTGDDTGANAVVVDEMTSGTLDIKKVSVGSVTITANTGGRIILGSVKKDVTTRGDVRLTGNIEGALDVAANTAKVSGSIVVTGNTTLTGDVEGLAEGAEITFVGTVATGSNFAESEDAQTGNAVQGTTYVWTLLQNASYRWIAKAA